MAEARHSIATEPEVAAFGRQHLDAAGHWVRSRVWASSTWPGRAGRFEPPGGGGHKGGGQGQGRATNTER